MTTNEGYAHAQAAAQHRLLRTYLQYNCIIGFELGKTKYYPAFQFRDGKIIDALADIYQTVLANHPAADKTQVAAALIEWRQAPHQRLPRTKYGGFQLLIDLLQTVVETEFVTVIKKTDAMRSFVSPIFSTEQSPSNGERS